MNALEKKKKEVQLKQVEASIADLECRILEREEDIQRIKEHLKIQQQKLEEISNELL